jgi:septum site-determining protein MinD
MKSLESKPIAMGVVLNRVKKKRYEISTDEVGQFTELPVIGNIPEDEKILESTNKRSLIAVSDKNSPASIAFFEIAAKLTGIEYSRPNIFDRIMGIFGRRT